MFSDLKYDNGLNLNYQPYKYSDYNDCNSAHDSDKNNLSTNIFPDSKYYSGNVFSTSSKSLVLTRDIFYSLECTYLEFQLQRN